MRRAVGQALLLSAFSLAVLYFFRVELEIAKSGVVSPWDSPLLIAFKAGGRLGSDSAAVLLGSGLAVAAIRMAGPRVGLAVHSVLLTLIVVAGAINVPVTSIYGQPPSFGLLQFAGLRNLDTAAALSRYVSRLDVMRTVAALCVMLFAAWLVHRTPLEKVARWRWTNFLILAAMAVSTLPLAITTAGKPREENAFAWIVRTSFARPMAMASTVQPDPTRLLETVPVRAPGIVSARALPKAEVRNVVLVVMESVGQVYLDGAERERLMPELSKAAPYSTSFTAAYAHVPASITALYSTLTGRYAPVDETATPSARVRRQVRSLPRALRENGYDTGAFFSMPWEKAGFAYFLNEQKLDTVRDGESMHCSGAEAALPGSLDPGVVNDACTFRTAQDWIASREKPFLAMIWTDQTHYPYRSPQTPAETGIAITLDAAAMKQRYLAGIRRTDKAIGSLLHALREQGRLDDTLVVVTGDHGEAFNQHGKLAHGYDVYDESVRVPLVFINPRLFKGSERDDPVGQIDITPTILAVLGIDDNQPRDGNSLLSPRLRARTFMASPWGGTLGMRDRTGKYSYNFITARFETEGAAGQDTQSVSPALTAQRQEEIIADMWNWVGVVNRSYRGH